MVKGAKLDGSDVKELYRFSTTNSLQKASPLGLAIGIATPRATTATTTTTAQATTTVTMKPGCKDMAGASRGYGRWQRKGRARPWEDSWGYTCKEYAEKKWCTLSGGYGTGWPKTGDTFDTFKNNGVTALQACCACGGGQ